jgi:hypothetical protein
VLVKRTASTRRRGVHGNRVLPRDTGSHFAPQRLLRLTRTPPIAPPRRNTQFAALKHRLCLHHLTTTVALLAGAALTALNFPLSLSLSLRGVSCRAAPAMVRHCELCKAKRAALVRPKNQHQVLRRPTESSSCSSSQLIHDFSLIFQSEP